MADGPPEESSGTRLAVVLGEVVSKTVVVTAPVPERVGGLVAVQTGVPGRLAGVTEQVSETWPVKPPAGVSVTVDVPDAPAVRVTEVPVNEKAGVTGCAVKTTGTLTAVDRAPLVPDTVTV
jgi:hypothetical protein